MSGTDYARLASGVRTHLRFRETNVPRVPSIAELREWAEAFEALAQQADNRDDAGVWIRENLPKSLHEMTTVEVMQLLLAGGIAAEQDLIHAERTPTAVPAGEAVALYDAASKGFHISETSGLDGKYWHVSKFRSMADLHAFTDAWTAAMVAVRDRAHPPAAEAREGMVPPEMAISASGIRSSGMYVKGWNDCRTAMLAASAKPHSVGLEAVRRAVADYMSSEGCSCCRDSDAHDAHAKRLAELLSVPAYDDGSGYKFHEFRSKE